MPLPVEKSQGSVSSLISRFQNAADANERRKVQESQARPVGRLSVGGNGPVAAAKKAVETVKEAVVGEPKIDKPNGEIKADASKDQPAITVKEDVVPPAGEDGEAQSLETEEPVKEAATEDKAKQVSPVDTVTEDAPENSETSPGEVLSEVDAPKAAALEASLPTPDTDEAEPSLDKPTPQSPIKGTSSSSKASTPSSIPRAARATSTSLTPQRTGPMRARPSTGTDSLKPQATGSGVSPLKPQLTGTPTRPTAASLARAKESQERRAAAEAKNATLPKAAVSRRSVTPGKSAIPAPSPASRERKVSATSSSGSSIPRAVRRVSGTPSPSPAPASEKKMTPSSTEHRTASTPSSSLMRGTASSRLKAASASPSPTQVKTKPSAHIVAKTKKPQGVVPIDRARVSAEPEFRVGLPGAPANQASADA